MPTLYNLAEKNIRKTWILLTTFFIFIILIGWLFSYYFQSKAILYFAVFLATFQSFLSYWYSDKIVLAIAKAKEIKREDNPEIYRLVENLCIAAGLPLPKIYIIDEAQPNAFATGRDEKHAAIALTRGLLEKLEKPEIEGVIAHELSHIKNKDILLQSVVVVLVGVISILSDFFLRMSYFGTRRSDRDEDSAGAILFFLGLIAAILAPIAATLIQLAISRKREFLADATGALITRYPEGLARALEKISTDPNPLRVANNSTAHLYIASPFRGKERTNWFIKLFMTHPPVEERIKALREMSV
jgi:heat shock protein HtpX